MKMGKVDGACSMHGEGRKYVLNVNLKACMEAETRLTWTAEGKLTQNLRWRQSSYMIIFHYSCCAQGWDK